MRFHLDEHVDPAIAEGLRRRGIDVTTTVEAGLRRATDLAHIEFANRSSRVIVTQDEDFLVAAASDVPHSGVIYAHQQSRSIGEMIEFILLVNGCMTEEEMKDHVEFA
jgi:predicted nuclease of predicted toxin-antitoxin system